MSSKTTTDTSIVAKVESYFFEDDDFANLFENFAWPITLIISEISLYDYDTSLQ